MMSPGVQLMVSQIAERSPGSSPSGLFEGGFSWGLVLLCTVGVAALVFICSLGFIARLRDRTAEREANLRADQLRADSPREDHPTAER